MCAIPRTLSGEMAVNVNIVKHGSCFEPKFLKIRNFRTGAVYPHLTKPYMDAPKFQLNASLIRLSDPKLYKLYDPKLNSIWMPKNHDKTNKIQPLRGMVPEISELSLKIPIFLMNKSLFCAFK